MVFLHKSAVNKHILYQNFRWLAYEISPKAIWQVKRLERWSILPAYSLNEVLAIYIHQGRIITA